MVQLARNKPPRDAATGRFLPPKDEVPEPSLPSHREASKEKDTYPPLPAEETQTESRQETIEKRFLVRQVRSRTTLLLPRGTPSAPQLAIEAGRWNKPHRGRVSGCSHPKEAQFCDEPVSKRQSIEIITEKGKQPIGKP